MLPIIIIGLAVLSTINAVPDESTIEGETTFTINGAPEYNAGADVGGNKVQYKYGMGGQNQQGDQAGNNNGQQVHHYTYNIPGRANQGHKVGGGGVSNPIIYSVTGQNQPAGQGINGQLNSNGRNTGLNINVNGNQGGNGFTNVNGKISGSINLNGKGGGSVNLNGKGGGPFNANGKTNCSDGAIQNIINSLTNKINEGINGVGNFVGNKLTDDGQLLPPIGGGVQAIEAAKTALLIGGFDGLRKALNRASCGVGDLLGDTEDLLDNGDIAGGINSFGSDLGSGIASITSGVLNFAQKGVGGFLNDAQNGVGGFLTDAQSGINTLLDTTQDAVEDVAAFLT